MRSPKHEETMKNLGKSVAYYRQEKKMTQQELAKRIKRKTKFIKDLETSQLPTRVSLTVILNIADALEITMCELLKSV